MASVPHSRMFGETDMETQIHQLEQEAYSSVLRAFKAQADLITWVLFCYFFMDLHVCSGFNDCYINVFSSGKGKFNNRTEKGVKIIK